MKQRELVRAYNSLSDINKCKLNDGKLAMNIFSLMSKLQPSIDFQIQEEEKIFSEHPNFNPQFGGVVIKEGVSQEDASKEAKNVSEELKKLGEIEVDFEFEPFDLDLERNNIPISGEDIGNLKSFIHFI